MDDRTVLEEISAHETDTSEVLAAVLAHPELGHEEHWTSQYLCGRLGEAGLDVEMGIAGMPTAFLGRLQGSTRGKTVGLVMLYDAVPSVTGAGVISPVHSCGHPTIAAGVWAATRALARVKDGLDGNVVVVGCPADEIHAPKTRQLGGGKALTASGGVWDDIDVALYVHPEYVNTVSQSSQWMRRGILTVSGTRSLTSEQPQAPLNALDALIAATERNPANGILEHIELDGDVEEATGLVLSAEILFLGRDLGELNSITEAFRVDVGGEWSYGPLVPSVRPNASVTAMVADAFEVLGKDFVADPPPLPFATDFGTISHLVPAALIGVGRPGGWGFHTERGAREFSSPDGLDSALDIARVLALTVLRICR